MKKLPLYFLLLITAVACSHKPKPISNQVGKTTVQVGGQKDSVVNNTDKYYNAATISGPCEQSVLRVIQATDEFKKATNNQPPGSFTYALNLVKAGQPATPDKGTKMVNGIQINVYDKPSGDKKMVATFLFDNQNAKLYYIDDGQRTMLPDIDPTQLKMIRNACFWGVASR